MRLDIGTKIVDLVDVSGSRGGGEAAPATGAAGFDADLRLLRRRVVRRWALAVVGRYAIGALALAIVPALLAAFGVIGWVWAVVLPGALFLVALGARLSRPPSLGEVARLLDDRLGLFDVTATALQVERSGGPVDEGPAAPVFAEAAALLRAGAATWKPRARLGVRELGVAIGLLVALALIVVLGTVGAGGGSEKVTALAGPGGAHSKGHRMTNVSPPLVPPRAKRLAGKRGASPYQEARKALGLYDFGFEGKRELQRGKQTRASGLYSHGAPGSHQAPQSLGSQVPGEQNEAREKAEAEASHANEKSTPDGERESAGGNAPEALKSLTGGHAPPSGSVSPLPNANAGGGPAGQQAQASAPGSSGNPGQRGAAGGSGKGGGGSPAGGGSAGSQRASLAGREESREGGRTGSDALGLKAGFAAAGGRKAAGARGPHGAQGGGGPGRSAGIAGSAFEEAEAGSLGYVPPDAGISPSLDPGLFARYLNALAAIAGRQW